MNTRNADWGPLGGFRGVWIPREIWLDEDLSPEEIVILGEIHSSTNSDNIYHDPIDNLASFLGVSQNEVLEYIVLLGKRGYIELRTDGALRLTRKTGYFVGGVE